MTHPIICKTSRRPTVKGFGSRSCRRKVLPNAVRAGRRMQKAGAAQVELRSAVGQPCRYGAARDAKRANCLCRAAHGTSHAAHIRCVEHIQL